jgi:hypothetical protein
VCQGDTTPGRIAPGITVFESHHIGGSPPGSPSADPDLSPRGIAETGIRPATAPDALPGAESQLRTGQVELAFRPENIAVEVCDPLPPA